MNAMIEVHLGQKPCLAGGSLRSTGPGIIIGYAHLDNAGWLDPHFMPEGKGCGRTHYNPKKRWELSSKASEPLGLGGGNGLLYVAESSGQNGVYTVPESSCYFDRDYPVLLDISTNVEI